MRKELRSMLVALHVVDKAGFLTCTLLIFNEYLISRLAERSDTFFC